MKYFAFITLMCAESLDSIIASLVLRGYTVGPGVVDQKTYSPHAISGMKQAASTLAVLQLDFNGTKSVSDVQTDLRESAKKVSYYSLIVADSVAAAFIGTNIDVGNVQRKPKKNVPYLKAVEDKKLSDYDSLVDDSEGKKNV